MPKVQLNRVAIAELLKSDEMQTLVLEAAQDIAKNVEAQDIKVGDRDGRPNEYELPVTASVVLTDRAHGRVSIPHASGEAVQAKHGALTKAAKQSGFDVKVRES